MLRLSFTGNVFRINETPLTLPISINALHRLIGPSRHSAPMHAHAWDEHGLWASSQDGVLVDNLIPELTDHNLPFHPTQRFNGSFTVDGEDILLYYRNHRSRRVKLFHGDDGGALVFGDLHVYFSLREGRVSDLTIGPHKLATEPDPLPLDPEYAHFAALWKDWTDAVGRFVPANNRYHNLKHGITAEALAQALEASEFEWPPALLNFYRPFDVIWDPVSSPFSFKVADWQYDLLPFGELQDRWAHLMAQQHGADMRPESPTQVSDKVKSRDHSNLKWIPIAEGRNGDFLLFDNDPSELGTAGQIIELRNESWTRKVIASSLEALVHQEIATIEAEGRERFSFFLADDFVGG